VLAEIFRQEYQAITYNEVSVNVNHKNGARFARKHTRGENQKIYFCQFSSSYAQLSSEGNFSPP
jgi:hypothetical protein